MDKIPGHVRVFSLVHRPVGADKMSGPGIGQQILQNGLVAPVHIFLGGFGHIDVAEAAGGTGTAEHHVHNKGVAAVVIPASLGIFRLIFRGEQHRLPHKLAVVEHLSAPHLLFVVPVDDGGFVRGIHPILVYIPVSRLGAAGKLALQHGVALQQQIVVPEPQVKDVAALLQIRHAVFPEEVQQVNPLNAHISQAVQLFRIPEDTVDAGAGLQLVVHHPVVGFLKVLLLQNHRQDAFQSFRRFPVPFLPGQHGGDRVVVHGLGMLIGDGVEEPAGGGLHLAALTPAHTLPVPHPVPLLVFNHPPFQVGLALPVAVQGQPGLTQLRRPDCFRRFHR